MNETTSILPASTERKPRRRRARLVGAAVAVTLLGGGAAALLLRDGQVAPGQAVTRPVDRGKAMTFAEIFERVSPAVVSINVTLPARSRQALPFDLELEDEEGEGGLGLEQQSSGSGFFISADGLVLTNNHVVRGGGKITAVLKDGRELTATVIGRDENTDLALLKVQDPKDPKAKFAFVDFQDAAKPRVGEWVIAIGNPFGFGGTATAGIVSAYDRDIGEGVEFLQIDAPINRGNSGGPSFDVYGRVIGVNTAIYSPSGGSVGIGFAVPAELAASVSRQLATGRSILRGYIGASVVTVTPGLARAQGLGVDRGALVVDLVPGGPAARAGLKEADVVVAVGGEAVAASGEMTRAIGKTKPGQIVRLSVFRDGRRRTVIVRTGTRPPERELTGPRLEDGRG